MLGHKKTQHITTRCALCLMLTGLLLMACDDATPAKTYSVGVVNYVATLTPVFEAFKARMAELGYVEGKNVTYIYHGTLAPDPQVIEREVRSLLAQKVDLYLTVGTQPTLVAKKAIEGTIIPVVFAPAINPMKEGIVESLIRPGGNVTGVQNSDTFPKALEWLHKIVPQAMKAYLRCGKVDKSLSMVSWAPRGGAPWRPSSCGRAMATLSGRRSSWGNWSTSIPLAKS